MSLKPAQAIETPNIRLQSSLVQGKTVQALKAIESGNWVKGKALIAQTKDPLAAKLYFWLYFKQAKKSPNFNRLTRFINLNPEWPGLSELRLRAEKNMPKDLAVRDVVSWFDLYKPLTAQGVDRYVDALLVSGKKEQARKYLTQWWSATLVSRKDQRYLYKKYGNLIEMSAHRRRLDRLLFAGSYTNARAIARVLGTGYPELAEARIALAEEKNGVNRLIARVPDKLQNDPGLLYERLRWRRRAGLDSRAIEILNKSPSLDQMQNPSAWWRERHIVIRRLLEKKRYKSAYMLASGHVQKKGLSFAQGEWLSGWLALQFLDSPTIAYQHFETLYHGVSSPVSRARASYWAGRAAKVLGGEELAYSWFKKAARYQTAFYGQMAGGELGLANTLPYVMAPKLMEEERRSFNRHELVQVARLFHKAGQRKESGRFIQAFVQNSDDPKAYRFAAELAVELDQKHESIRISKAATKKGLFLSAHAYPVITSHLNDVDLEWALVHALIRQESMFDYRANSPAGAKGLMQLMPATANSVARKIGVSHRTNWLTTKPDHNILLGTQYLEEMLIRFGGAYPLAIAAYNAGPGRVDQWLKTFGDPRIDKIDIIDWIELIPIYETRNYIQRVMEGVYIYRLRLKDVQKQGDYPIHISMK